MTSENRVTRHLCVAVDAERYSRLDTLQQEIAQADLLRVLQVAAHASGLDRNLWQMQPQGDQEFAVLPNDTVEAVVIADFVHHLTAALAARNSGVSRTARLRLRLAVDFGVARPAALGHSGPAPVSVARYVNATPLKEVLRLASPKDLAVIVSHQLYQDVIRLRLHGLDPEAYVRVHVEQSEFAGYGWIHAPGADPAAVREATGSWTAPTPPGGGARGASPTQPHISRVRTGGHFIWSGGDTVINGGDR